MKKYMILFLCFIIIGSIIYSQIYDKEQEKTPIATITYQIKESVGTRKRYINLEELKSGMNFLAETFYASIISDGKIYTYDRYMAMDRFIVADNNTKLLTYYQSTSSTDKRTQEEANESRFYKFKEVPMAEIPISSLHNEKEKLYWTILKPLSQYELFGYGGYQELVLREYGVKP